MSKKTGKKCVKLGKVVAEIKRRIETLRNFHCDVSQRGKRFELMIWLQSVRGWLLASEKRKLASIFGAYMKRFNLAIEDLAEHGRAVYCCFKYVPKRRQA